MGNLTPKCVGKGKVELLGTGTMPPLYLYVYVYKVLPRYCHIQNKNEDCQISDVYSKIFKTYLRIFTTKEFKKIKFHQPALVQMSRMLKNGTPKIHSTKLTGGFLGYKKPPKIWSLNWSENQLF